LEIISRHSHFNGTSKDGSRDPVSVLEKWKLELQKVIGPYAFLFKIINNDATMILEQMSDNEVLAQYKKDFEELKTRRRGHVANVTFKNARKANHFPFADAFHIKLPNRNDYYVISFVNDKSMLKKRQVSFSTGSIIDTERGKMFILFTDDEYEERCVLWFTAHFFSRYAQRNGLDENMPIEKVIKLFVLKNSASCREPEVINYKGENRLIFCFKDGVGMAQEKNGKMVMMTYLPHDILTEKQSQRRDVLEPDRKAYEEIIRERRKNYKRYERTVTNNYCQLF